MTITTDPRNANKGTARGRALLEKSLRSYGAGRSVLADKHGTLIAGNKTYEAAFDLGLPTRVVETDGNELIVVQRTDLDLGSDRAAKELGVADNRVGQVSLEWDTTVLSELVDEGVDLEAFWHEDELDALLGTVQPAAADPGAQVDRAEELRDKWQTARGDLWLIGPHRLLCGDATSAEDVARLMDGARARMVVTSPPYNQNIETFRPSGMQRESPAFVDRMAGAYHDSMPEDEYQSQQVRMLELLATHLTTDGSIFYNHKIRYRDKRVISPYEWLSVLSFPIRQEIIWDRGSSITMNARMFIPADERIYWLRVGDDFLFNDTVEVKSWSTVWEVAAQNDVQASAAFATEIPTRCIRAASEAGDIILEPYSGSGTTIVAAEQTGRVCYGMEIEPKYVAVALDRMAGMGLEPRRAD